jgi:enoyl-CoA hydratase/carnithine racemase
MANALSSACQLVEENDGLQLVVLSANGEVFSIDDGKEPGVNAAGRLAGLTVPVLVALNGEATGAGLELALCGDLRVCVPSAKFGFPGLTKGVLPQNGGTQRLPRLVGPAWARDMLLTGRMVDAHEALSIGLVNRVADDLKTTVAEISAQVTGGSPIGARYAKEAVTKGMDLALEQGLGLEADLNVILQSTTDRAEGLKSFLEKRSPEFKGS